MFWWDKGGVNVLSHALGRDPLNCVTPFTHLVFQHVILCKYLLAGCFTVFVFLHGCHQHIHQLLCSPSGFTCDNIRKTQVFCKHAKLWQYFDSTSNFVFLSIRFEALWHTTSQLYTNMTIEVSWRGFYLAKVDPMTTSYVVFNLNDSSCQFTTPPWRRRIIPAFMQITFRSWWPGKEKLFLETCSIVQLPGDDSKYVLYIYMIRKADWRNLFWCVL